MRSVDVAFSAIFAALALAIPLFFRGTLQIVIPSIGYSATLGSHVLVMLSVLFGPLVTAIVGTASTLGFFATLGPVVGAGAAIHHTIDSIISILVWRAALPLIKIMKRHA